MKNLSYKELYKVIMNLDKSIPIYISGHINPDYDTIGTSMALTYFFRKIGFNSYCLIREDNQYLLNVFNSKNYVAERIDIENYIFISVDLNRKSRLGEDYSAYFENAKTTINIDHHLDNLLEADYNLVNSDYSSTAEIFYELSLEFDCDLDKDIAEFIFAGIITDTRNFLHARNEKPFKTVSELFKYNIEHRHLMKKIMTDRDEKDMEALKDMLNNIQFDMFHYIVIDMEKDLYNGFEGMYRVKKNVPLLMNPGIELLVIFFVNKDEIRASLRSANEIDVNKIANLFGGGGHKQAAGYNTTKSLEENIELIKNSLQ